MIASADFIVLDTEGRDFLSEIAVIDSQGKLVYEAFTAEYERFEEIKLKHKSLEQIILDLIELAHNKVIVCHYAKHDRQIILKSCNKAGIQWRELKFACTYQLAKKTFNNFPSYSLEYLSKKLNLKVDRKYFNPQQAHTARYDAKFTYQLYCQLKNIQEIAPVNLKPNPFGSSRVDNPFQNHPDLASIHQEQFTTLKTIITDIKYDPNYQSKGAVVIGEPGTGKTHLMMRLANE